MKINNLVILLLLVIMCACGDKKEEKQLPVLGRKEITPTDTIYHTIADFKFVNQDSTWVTPETFRNKIYVADFFFTSCPTICPIMKTQMLRVYETIQDKPDVLILSHTIDPKHDTVAVLNEFAERLGVKSDKWHFVTGEKDDIYKIGQTSYMVTASEDPTEPGGYIHSGAFILVDKEKRVRGVYDGTKPDQVDRLIKDIDVLLREYK
ncbi:putative copper metallochaperone [Fulvivirga imtechensis AK7]|uniref:Putative copper metallochaperone n=1 Tax=Fulvivirga imtechensis AK7 TaxID=1237149 RepID=L8JLE3_9BACT|nr:SCO family protein [Fulvivirga imtechensis]ELR68304.1 putative copper metallochaperone [Fulvivirga imtechensis AK7]